MIRIIRLYDNTLLTVHSWCSSVCVTLHQFTW